MNKATIYAIGIVLAVGVAGFAVNEAMAKKNAALEIAARKAEANLKAKEAELKKAESAERKAKADEAAAQANRVAKEEERKAKIAERDAVKVQAAVSEAEAMKAKAAQAKATEEAKKAEAEKKSALARKSEAEALAEYAAATNAMRQAELQTALAATKIVELDLQKILATSNTLALQKANYQQKLEEVQKLQEELRRREAETRPNKTLMQIIEANEKAREAELRELAKKDAAFAKEEEIRRRILREGVPAAPKKPLTGMDKKLAEANEELDAMYRTESELLSRNITIQLEGMIRIAAAEGRIDDAECYAKMLKSMVPSYKP